MKTSQSLEVTLAKLGITGFGKNRNRRFGLVTQHRTQISPSLHPIFHVSAMPDLTLFYSNTNLHEYMYSNLLLKYTLLTEAVGEHLVGRCILYSYHWCSRCPLNTIWPFIIYLSNQSYRTPPQIENEDITCHYRALFSTSTTNCFVPMFKQKLEEMYDELQQSIETFHRDVNKPTLNV